MARPTLCSSPRWGPTRPSAASRLRHSSAASECDGGDELARVVGEQETFSRVTLEWPWSGLDRRRLIALSAAPMFGRQREFLGYRGFGVLGEEIDAVAMPEDNLSAELAGDHRSALPAAFEPEPQAPESAARPVESSPEFAAHE